MTETLILPLRCRVQTYAWGKLGLDSVVSHLGLSGSHLDNINKEVTYAELWMGTHESAPSFVKSDDGADGKKGKDVLLSVWLAQYPGVLLNDDQLINNRSAAAEGMGIQLPFLFKVLSIAKGLSIQAHPDKVLATKLHIEDPVHYPDSNHKPELAIAITNFEAMCGFRPVEEVSHFANSIPEFAAVLGEEAVQCLLTHSSNSKGSDDLRVAFRALMLCSSSFIKTQLELLVARLHKQTELSYEEELIIRLDRQFPGGDSGCFCVLFLNCLRLKPDQAIFLGPNEPHSYLSGDCIECMACSDNVVRSGCTSKFKDVDTLCSMLTYVPSSAQSQLVVPRITRSGASDALTTLTYLVPIDEFAVDCVRLHSGNSAELTVYRGPSIIICVQGTGAIASCQNEHQVVSGSVFFVAAGAAIKATAIHKDKNLTFFRAYSLNL